LGLRPTPRSGSLQRSLRPPNWISGVVLLRGSWGKGREGEGRKKGRVKGKKGKRRRVEEENEK